MDALFVESDPDLRMELHELAHAWDLDHALAATSHEAMALLAASPSRVKVVITALDLSDMTGDTFAHSIRAYSDHTAIFAHGEPKEIRGGDSFERVFFEPHGLPGLMEAIRGLLGQHSEHDLLHAPNSAA